ncbi:hypothetical protein ACFVY0_48480, partial [Streptomyces sp. NPDC058286]
MPITIDGAMCPMEPVSGWFRVPGQERPDAKRMRAHAYTVLMLLSFLAARGLDLRLATETDVLDFRRWRREERRGDGRRGHLGSTSRPEAPGERPVDDITCVARVTCGMSGIYLSPGCQKMHSMIPSVPSVVPRRSARLAPVLSAALALALTSTQPAQAAAEKDTSGPTRAEASVSAYLRSVRDRPKELAAFFRALPKGADLHNHLS